MAELTVKRIVEDGLDPAMEAADVAGDTFQNDSSGRRFLLFRNNDTASTTVTIAAVQNSIQIDGWGDLDKADIQISIPAGEDRLVGPLPYKAFGSAPAISYSSVTALEAAALRI